MTTMLSRPAPAAPAPKLINPGVQLMLAVVGSVCGTLAVGAVGTSPTAKLVGAALGAAIPALMTLAGPYPLARAVAGIAITGGLVLTYGGFTLFSYAADRPARFPLPAAAPDPAAPAQQDPAPGGGSAGPVRHGSTGLSVDPGSLHCTQTGCADPVRLRNGSNGELETGTIEIDGSDRFTILGNECGPVLEGGSSCAITLGFTAATGEPSSARLVIPNPAGEELSVALGGDAATVATNLEPDATVCAPRADGDGLVLPILARVTGDDGGADQVKLAASVDGGAPQSADVTVNGDAITLTPAVTQEQLDGGVTVTVTADPDGAVAETDETDNSISPESAGRC